MKLFLLENIKSLQYGLNRLKKGGGGGLYSIKSSSAVFVSFVDILLSRCQVKLLNIIFWVLK